EFFLGSYERLRRQPKHIVYYRAGVPASCLSDVVNAEMWALRMAFRMLDADYEPRVTFVVANKHHRLRCSARDESRQCNPPPPLVGTIVDSGTLVDPQCFEFYLFWNKCADSV
ncbi:hypothetical protein PHYSODRAFT_499542, partial [Phytophthora sojae]